MTGQGRLDGDRGGLAVADLAHQDDVGVLAQEGPQRGGEGQPDLPVHLHLIDASQRIFDRILRRPDD